MRKRLVLRWSLGFIVVAIAVMIFVFSAQDGDKSSEVSRGVMHMVKDVLRPLVTFLTGKKPTTRELNLIVRKLGHFTEFAALAFFFRLFLHTYRHWGVAHWAWLAVTLYACTDELHQMFTPGRGPQLRDVLIDAGGAAFGILIAWMILCAIRAFRRRMHSGFTK